EPTGVTVFGVLTSTRGGAPVHWLGSTTLFGVAEQSSIKMASALSHQTVLGVLPNAGGGAGTVPLSSTATQSFVPALEQDCLGTNRRDSVWRSHEHQGRRSSALARFNHPFWRRGAEFNQNGLRIVAPDSAWCASKRRRRCCNSTAQFNRNSIFRTSIGAGLPRNQPARQCFSISFALREGMQCTG